MQILQEQKSAPLPTSLPSTLLTLVDFHIGNCWVDLIFRFSIAEDLKFIFSTLWLMRLPSRLEVSGLAGAVLKVCGAKMAALFPLCILLFS